MPESSLKIEPPGPAADRTAHGSAPISTVEPAAESHCRPISGWMSLWGPWRVVSWSLVRSPRFSLRVTPIRGRSTLPLDATEASTQESP
ncbi:MAG TPA: hypothetical protein VMI94_01515 [Bryobacteraceae bacterium]|nr:hypothetical protein [Bryobacteraceae bacterium]